MGVYDTITVRCPACGEPYYAQSKSGDCFLKSMTLEEAVSSGDRALLDVNRHAPFECDCGALFFVEVTQVKPPVYIPGEYKAEVKLLEKEK